MISTVLSSEKISSAAQSEEMRLFQSFLNRTKYDDYSALYRKENLMAQLQECAAEQTTTPLRNSILALVDYLHDSKVFIYFLF